MSQTQRPSVKVCLECRSTFRTTRDTCPKDGAPLVERDLAPGALLSGKYRIEEEIGRGGMGVVYRGVHIVMGKRVAIKVISPLFSADPKFLEMFKAEARALAAFRHENVLTVHDFGESDGRYYLVMELLEGEILKDIMTRVGSLPPERAFPLLVRICDAVAAAHQADIVHLDIKGENVFVAEDAAGARVTVLDFGLARLAGQAPVQMDDRTTIGTVGYMAPEQIMGWDVDERTDIYALGVLAFEMLTGRLPFPGRSKNQILAAQVAGTTTGFPRKSPILKVIPKKTVKVILTAIHRDPDRRIQSAAEMQEAFKDALEVLKTAAGHLARRWRGVETGATGAEAPSLAAKARSFFARISKRSAAGPGAPEGMVYVPAGEFRMGSNHSSPDERPAMRIPLAAFFIDITPVTNRDYAGFVQATDHEPPGTWKTLSFPPGMGDIPVTGVTWQDAADYAEWAGKRLPSEAQWEKAARGTNARTFPWGAKWEPTYANWNGNPAFYGNAQVRSVGSSPRDRSPYGCLDMAGNVMEWTASWYKPYGPTSFKSEDFGEKFRVVRGGCFLSNDPGYLRATHRSHARPGETGVIGFRCVVEA
ncbi:MAG: SUMF1/EgtB/PvdO family nonheme iron enzyme [Planctomycetes bacterium]|nr:SUMF1/EgtB/PvdO family nonheme iron enzyme [Planctomycetota bacterium]